MEDKEAAVTVRVVDPATPPETACIVETPAVSAVARPEAEMVATDGVADDQVTEAVRFCVLPSLKVPVAANCWVAFLVRVAFAGVTAMDFRVAPATVKDIEPAMVPELAVMVLAPADFAVTIPLLLIEATLGFWELHTTLAEMSSDDPSLKCPVAANCWVVPIVIVALAGETPIEASCAWF
jgi:hypothetical protein